VNRQGRACSGEQVTALENFPGAVKPVISSVIAGVAFFACRRPKTAPVHGVLAVSPETPATGSGDQPAHSALPMTFSTRETAPPGLLAGGEQSRAAGQDLSIGHATHAKHCCFQVIRSCQKIMGLPLCTE
jgi:hypothetical protein